MRDSWLPPRWNGRQRIAHPINWARFPEYDVGVALVQTRAPHGHENRWHLYIRRIGEADIPSQLVLAQTVITTSLDTTQTITSDATWNNSNNSIEVIGGGAHGGRGASTSTSGGGGGGGAYSKIVNASITTPGTTQYFARVGSGGTWNTSAVDPAADSWWTLTSPGTSFPSSGTAVGAKAGASLAALTTATGSAGGALASAYASPATGSVKTSGGTGGGTAATATSGGGGGGAGGAAGNGATPGTGPSAGGAGNANTAGGGTGGAAGSPGVNGNAGTNIDGTRGSGGGGGGGNASPSTGGNGANYGGGGGGGGRSTGAGGSGAQGIVVLTWTPVSSGTGTPSADVATLSGSGTVIPAGTEWSGFTLRQIIPETGLSSGSNTLLVALETLAGTSGQLDAAYLGDVAASGDPYDFAATPVRLQYGGSNTRALSGAEIFKSDPATFSHTSGREVLFTAAFSGSYVRLSEAGSGSGYDAATDAWIAAVGSGNISTARKTLVDNLIVGLKADGVWAKLDRLWLFLAENTNSALVDLKETAAATAVNSPTFTIDSGYTSDNTSQYINSGFIPSTHGVNYSLNSASIGGWLQYSGSVGQFNLGGSWNSYRNALSVRPDFSDSLTFINGGASVSCSQFNQGFWIGKRTSSTSVSIYEETSSSSALATEPSSTAAGLDNVALYFFASNFGSPAFGNTAFTLYTTFIGGSLSDTEQANLYTRLKTYFASAVSVGITDTDALAWITAAFNNNGMVSHARAVAIETLIAGLKTDGIWSKLDRLWLFAAENAGSALVDLKTRALATATNSPAFSTTGYTFNGSSSYINTGYNPASGTNYTQDSAHIAVWPVTISSSAWAQHGNYDGSKGAGLEWGSTRWFMYINDNTLSDTGVTSGTGLITITRPSSSSRKLYANGSSSYSDSVARTGISSNNYYIGAGDAAGTANHFTTNTIAAFSIGGNLTDTENSNLYSRLRTYMTAAGVP